MLRHQSEASCVLGTSCSLHSTRHRVRPTLLPRHGIFGMSMFSSQLLPGIVPAEFIQHATSSGSTRAMPRRILVEAVPPPSADVLRRWSPVLQRSRTRGGLHGSRTKQASASTRGSSCWWHPPLNCLLLQRCSTSSCWRLRGSVLMYIIASPTVHTNTCSMFALYILSTL